MTNKEVIKALECCIKPTSDCDNCPYYGYDDDLQCFDMSKRDALDLINRQQAEIERLNGCVKSEEEVRAIANATIQAGIRIIKADAIKEFEAKIHEKLRQAEMHGNFEPVVTREMFDSVAKEVVGEGK